MNIRTIHRLNAILLGIFVVAHLANHLAAFRGVTAHIDVMKALRSVYRSSLVEPILIASFAVQAVTGLTRLIGGWKQRKGFVSWLQALTGLYVALFLVIHVGAVLSARSQGVDTNFYFAAAGLHVPGIASFFVPYYTLAVICLLSHIGCAFYWHLLGRGHLRQAKMALTAGIGLGICLSLAITGLLAGKLTKVEVPSSYTASFQQK